MQNFIGPNGAGLFASDAVNQLDSRQWDIGRRLLMWENILENHELFLLSSTQYLANTCIVYTAILSTQTQEVLKIIIIVMAGMARIGKIFTEVV